MKTVRFSAVVESCGQPEPYVLWSDPQKDPELQRSIKKNRVMTVHQANLGTKKEFGVIGFTKDSRAQFLIFPKPLGRFAGKRVVGVKYELLKTLDKKPRKSSRAREDAETYPVYNDVAEKKEDPGNPPRESEIAPTPMTTESAPEKEKQPALPKAVEETEEPPSTAPVKERSKAFTKEVRQAMKELKAGKAVAAYQRLEKALATIEP